MRRHIIEVAMFVSVLSLSLEADARYGDYAESSMESVDSNGGELRKIRRAVPEKPWLKKPIRSHLRGQRQSIRFDGSLIDPRIEHEIEAEIERDAECEATEALLDFYRQGDIPNRPSAAAEALYHEILTHHEKRERLGDYLSRALLNGVDCAGEVPEDLADDLAA